MAEQVLRELARQINELARAIIAEDGTHAAMFFLALPDGAVEQRLFSDTRDEPVGDARGRELAEAIQATGAESVICVSEGWSTSPESVPEGGGAGDASDAQDVLLVAGVDRDGDTVAIETRLRRTPDGVDVGESEEWAGTYQLSFLDLAKAALRRNP